MLLVVVAYRSALVRREEGEKKRNYANQTFDFGKEEEARANVEGATFFSVSSLLSG